MHRLIAVVGLAALVLTQLATPAGAATGVASRLQLRGHLPELGERPAMRVFQTQAAYDSFRTSLGEANVFPASSNMFMSFDRDILALYIRGNDTGGRCLRTGPSATLDGDTTTLDLLFESGHLWRAQQRALPVHPGGAGTDRRRWELMGHARAIGVRISAGRGRLARLRIARHEHDNAVARADRRREPEPVAGYDRGADDGRESQPFADRITDRRADDRRADDRRATGRAPLRRRRDPPLPSRVHRWARAHPLHPPLAATTTFCSQRGSSASAC